MAAQTLTMPDALKAKSLYEQGYSMLQIEGHLNRSRKQIKTAFVHLGVPLRSRSEFTRLRWAELKLPDKDSQ